MRHLSINMRLFLFLSLSSAARSSPASRLLRPRDTCSDNKLNSCGPDFDSQFCCPDNTSCVSLAGGTTALCCPDGADCNLIQPITCDLSSQDPDKSPGAPIKTNVFDVKLEKCGDDTCCPFGFSCGNGKCTQDKDQSLKPGEKSSPSGTSKPTSSGSKTSADATDTATASPSTENPSVIPTDATKTADGSIASSTGTANPDDASSSKSHSASKTSIIAGIVGGCVILLIIAALIFLYIRRSNRREANADARARMAKYPTMRQRPGGTDSHSGSVTHGNVISGPISQPGSYRTDFIRKQSGGLSELNDEKQGQGRDLTERSALAPKKKSGLFPRISIPNPFSSPNPSAASRSPADRSRFSTPSSLASDDDGYDYHHKVSSPPIRTGTVAARLAPIRALKASSRTARRSTAPQAYLSREPSGEDINIFADPETVGGGDGCNGYCEMAPPLATRTLAPINGRRESDRLTRGTTFTDLMEEAKLGGIHNGKKRYVPGTTPRI